MALRQYDPNATRRGMSEAPRASRGPPNQGFGPPAVQGPGGAMMPFGGGLFGGPDPFSAFGNHPFSGFGMGGSLMQRFDDVTRDIARGPGAMGSRHGAMMMGGGLGGGQYSCQTFAMSSVMGPDGKMHTERFSSSDVGNHEHGIRESQQAYSNSSTGTDKMGLERHVGDRARKMVKERDRNTMEERSTEMFKGLDETGRDAFDRDFSSRAQYLPQHPRFNGQALPGFGGAPALGGPGRQMPLPPQMAQTRSLAQAPHGRRY